MPASTLARLTTPRIKGDKYHHDILRYLGAFNASGVVLALIRVMQIRSLHSRLIAGQINYTDRDLDILAFSALGVANFSQCAMNFFWAKPSGRWIIGGLDRITVLDTVFSILDFGSLALVLAGY